MLAIVDDDEIFVYLTKKTIFKTERVERVEVFSNGEDALEFLRDNKDNMGSLPEIILLDLSMPVMDGWQFLEEFATIDTTIKEKITVYICSSSISPDDFARAKSINEVSGYIIKPITKHKLIEAIENL